MLSVFLYQETVAETLRPLAEGTEHHEESHTSTAGGFHCIFDKRDIIYGTGKTYF